MTQEKPDNIMNSQRKSPTQGRSKTMVSAIFEAAARVLPKSGYEGVTTNQLAKIAGVSVGSLYQYFSNKDEIYALLLEKNLTETKALVESVVHSKSNTPLDEIVREAISTVVDLNLDNRELIARLFVQAPRLNRVKRVMESRGQFIILLTEILKSRPLEVKRENLDLASYTIVHSVMGVIQAIVLQPPENLDRQQLKMELTELTLQYLCKVDTKTPDENQTR